MLNIEKVIETYLIFGIFIYAPEILSYTVFRSEVLLCKVDSFFVG